MGGGNPYVSQNVVKANASLDEIRIAEFQRSSGAAGSAESYRINDRAIVVASEDSIRSSSNRYAIPTMGSFPPHLLRASDLSTAEIRMTIYERFHPVGIAHGSIAKPHDASGDRKIPNKYPVQVAGTVTVLARTPLYAGDIAAVRIATITDPVLPSEMGTAPLVVTRGVRTTFGALAMLCVSRIEKPIVGGGGLPGSPSKTFGAPKLDAPSAFARRNVSQAVAEFALASVMLAGLSNTSKETAWSAFLDKMTERAGFAGPTRLDEALLTTVIDKPDDVFATIKSVLSDKSAVDKITHAAYFDQHLRSVMTIINMRRGRGEPYLRIEVNDDETQIKYDDFGDRVTYLPGRDNENRYAPYDVAELRIRTVTSKLWEWVLTDRTTTKDAWKGAYESDALGHLFPSNGAASRADYARRSSAFEGSFYIAPRAVSEGLGIDGSSPMTLTGRAFPGKGRAGQEFSKFVGNAALNLFSAFADLYDFESKWTLGTVIRGANVNHPAQVYLK